MNKEHEEGKCPVCGSTNVTYGDFEFFEDNGAYYNMTNVKTGEFLTKGAMTYD